MNTHTLIGIVQDGQLHVLVPAELAGTSPRLTTIDMQAARRPESGEVNLTPCEGRAIMVEGHGGHEWVYSTKIVDEAGPMLTAVVRQLYGKG